MNTKKNDFFASVVYQSDFSLEDFKAAGITPENSSMKSRDEYKNMKSVQELFTDEKTGNFDEKTFNQAYDNVLLLYNQYADNEQLIKATETKEYDPWAWWNEDPINKTKDVEPVLILGNNPLMETSSIVGMGLRTQSGLSTRELAQRQKIYDYESGQFLDETPNDFAGILTPWKRWSMPSLVLASYDEDTEEVVNGETIVHRKGELKFNEDGAPYYETLGNRETFGKDFLHIEDVRTVEGSNWNKLDWFDADGVDKNPWAALAKDVSRVAPFILAGIIGGPTFAGYLGAISAAGALMEFMPVFLKSVDGFFTNDVMGNDFGKTMNDLDAYMQRRQHSVSDKSREHLVTFENISKMFGDVSLQLFQQRSIANVPQLLKIKSIADNPKIASALSFGFMASTSSQEAYNIFKQAGADDRTTALAMWSLMGIYYKFMSSDYYKHALFKDTWIDEKSLKTQLKNVANDFAEAVGAGKVPARPNTPEDAARIVKWFNGAMNWLTDPAAKGVKGVLTSSLAEGVEETMEELSIDGLKVLAKGLEALGAPVGKEELDFGLTLEDITQRYLTSFVGGAFGGAIFHGYNSLDPNYRAAQNLAKTPEARLAELTHLISQGKKGELLETLNRMHDRGILGSKDLSGTKIATVTGTDGVETKVFAGADKDMSVNDLIYNEIYKQIDLIDNILTEERFKIGTDEIASLFSDDKEIIDKISEGQRNSFATGAANLIRVDLENIANHIINIRSQMKTLEGQVAGTGDSQKAKANVDEALKENQKYQELIERLKYYRDKRDAIYKKENLSEYISKAAFMLDTSLQTHLVGFNDEKSYAQFKYHKPFDEFNAAQQQIIKDEFEQYKSGENKSILRAAILYMDMSEEMQKELMEKEALLAKITPDTTVNVQTLGNELLEGIAKKKQLQQEITELKQKENPTTEDQSNLAKKEEELLKLAAELERIVANPATLVQRSKVKPLSAENVDEWADTLIDEYTAFSGKHKYNDDDLDLFLNHINKNFNPEAIRRQIEKQIFERYQLALHEISFGDEESKDDTYAKLSLGFNESAPEEFFWSPNETQIQRDFFNLIDTYYTNLGKDNNASKDAYIKIRSLLKDRVGMSDQDIDLFLFSNFEESEGPIIGKNVHNLGFSVIPTLSLKSGEVLTADQFFDRINNLRKNITYSNGVDLIKRFLDKVNGNELLPLLNILEQQEKKLTGIRIDQFVLSNSTTREQLNKLDSIINGISAMITGSYNGFNDFVNSYRSKEGKENLAILSDNTAKILINDLQNLKNRIKFILGLDALNSGQKLKEQKNIGVNMRLNFIKNIKSHVYIKDFEEKFFTDKDGKKLGKYDTFKDLIHDVTPDTFEIDDINGDNFAENEKYIIAIETALFEQIQSTGFTDDQLIDKIVDLYGKNALWKQRSTKLKSDTKEEEITDYDAALYLASIISLHTNDFYVKYRDTILEARQKDPNFNIVPVYGQEFAVRTIYSVLHNPDLFNRLLEGIANTYHGDDSYIESKKHLYNMISVLGGAGVGKTQGVGRIISLLLPNAEVRYICPSETQLKKLMAIDHDSKVEHGMTVDEWKEKFCPGIDAADNLEEKNGIISPKNDTAKNDGWFSDDTNTAKIIKIDEAAMNNSVVLKAISDFAVRQNAIVVAMGDTKQTPAKLKGLLDGYEDCWYLSTPELTATFRAENTAKAENYQMLFNKLDDVHKKRKDDPTIYAEHIDSLIDKTSIQLSYTETDDSIIGDYITSEEKSFDAIFDKLIDKGTKVSDILVVGDDSTSKKYTEGKYKDKVTFMNSKEAQGGEFKYVFVHKTMSDSLFDNLTDLYTFSQRGTTGSVILDSDKRFKELGVSSVKKVDAARPFEMSEEQRNDFAEWRLSALEGLSYSENYEDNLRIGTKSSEENPKKTKDDETMPPDKNGNNGNPANSNDKKAPATPNRLRQKSDVKNNITTNDDGTDSHGEPGDNIDEPGESSGDEAAPEIPVLEGFVGTGTARATINNDYEKYTETIDGYFEAGDAITRLYDPDFFSKEKSDKQSLYNFLVANNVTILKLSEYKAFVESIIKDVFSWKENDGKKPEFSKIPSPTIKKLFDTSTVEAFCENINDNQVISLHITNDDNGTYCIIPLAYVSGLNSGKFRSVKGIFEHILRPRFKRNDKEFITIAELKKKYPWLHINRYVGIVRGFVDSRNAKPEDLTKEKFESFGFDEATIEYYESNSGKAFAFASGLAPVDDDQTLKTGITRDGTKLWLYSHEEDIREFGIQDLVESEDHEKLAKYCAAIYALYNGDYESIKSYGFTDKKSVIEFLNRETGGDWSKLNSRSLSNEEFMSINSELDKKHSFLNHQTNKRVIANLIGQALANPDANKAVLLGIDFELKKIIKSNPKKPAKIKGFLLQFNKDIQYLIALDPETLSKDQKTLNLYRVTKNKDGSYNYDKLNEKSYTGNFISSFKELIQESIFDGELKEYGMSFEDFNAFNGRQATFVNIDLNDDKKTFSKHYEQSNSGQLYPFFRGNLVAFKQALQSAPFKNGIYANIHTVGDPEQDSYYLKANIEDRFVTNATEWKSDIYKVKTEMINTLISSTATNEQKSFTRLDEILESLNDLEQKMSKLGIVEEERIKRFRDIANNTVFEDDKSMEDFLNDCIDEINNEIINRTIDINTKVLKLDKTTFGINIVNINTRKQAELNLLNNQGGYNVSELEYVQEGDNLVSLPRSVSVTIDPSNNQQHIIFFVENNKLRFQKTSAFSNWMSLKIRANIAEDTILSEEAINNLSTNELKSKERSRRFHYGNIFTYVDGILTDDLTDSNVSSYWSSYKALLQLGDENILSIQSELENYIIARLKSENNEC